MGWDETGVCVCVCRPCMSRSELTGVVGEDGKGWKG